MSKIIMICGKVCCGKSTYAKRLKEELCAVILSTDEATFDLTGNAQGEEYNLFAARVNEYLLKKAAEIALAGANVILDWGFWAKADRRRACELFKARGVKRELHYIDISDAEWEKRISERNKRIEGGLRNSDFYIDENLKQKSLSLFEPPEAGEVDVLVFK